jgi:diazepam-binding inhibitor (GABA receptor modulator, acyl-CoA-binding protein)
VYQFFQFPDNMSPKDGGRVFAKVVGMVAAVGLVSFVFWHQKKRKRRRRPPASQQGAAVNEPDVILLGLFDEACKAVESLTLSNGDKLMLYGLYKQATQGDAETTDKPSILNVIGTAKHQAWMQFRSTTQEAAMMHYIQAVGELGVTANGDDEDYGPGNSLGMKPSSMVHEQVLALDASATVEEQLRRAASEGAYESMASLLTSSADAIDINAPDDSGQTALHFCADRGHLSGVKLLLKSGAVVDSLDHDGISVLQAAVIAGHVDICSLLLHHGADPDHLDADEDSPRSCAEGDDDMMALFQMLGKVNVQMNEGKVWA